MRFEKKKGKKGLSGDTEGIFASNIFKYGKIW